MGGGGELGQTLGLGDDSGRAGRLRSRRNGFCLRAKRGPSICDLRGRDAAICMRRPTSFSRALLWKNNEILWMSSDLSHCLKAGEGERRASHIWCPITETDKKQQKKKKTFFAQLELKKRES